VIIVLEGVDGTGKTTVSKKVADDLGVNYRHYPVDYQLAYSIIGDKQLAMAFDMVSNTVNPEANWLFDRYLPSSVVYGMDWQLYNTLESSVPPADRNILLYCEPGVAYKRILGRGVDDLDPTELQLKYYQDKYLSLDIWDKVLDTTNKTKQEVYNEVRGYAEACYNGIL
jgi:dTMP kinase